MSELRADLGDATAEYRALRSGSGYVSGVSRLLWAEGADALQFLDGQLSQDLTTLSLGEVARSLLLEPRGKLVATMWVLNGADGIGLVVDSGVLDRVLERLESFRFRVEVEFRIDDRPVHELWGSGAVPTALAAGFDPSPGWREIGHGLVVRLSGESVDRVLIVGDESGLRDAGAIPVGAMAWTTVRIESGVPLSGIDIDETTIPQEMGPVDASVSFSKGCYVGQELVARIDSRGRVNRRLVGVVIRENVLPPVGAKVMLDGEERGSITSVGESLALRAPVAMGIVRREVEDGSTVQISWGGGSAEAVVRSLPLLDFSDIANTSLTGDVETDTDTTGA